MEGVTMPDRQLPAWARWTKWALYGAVYALVLIEAYDAALNHPQAVMRAFGHPLTNLFAWGVVGSTTAALGGHLLGNWLLQRALLPWAATGALIYAVVLADRLVLIAAITIGLRIVELEVFARRQPRRHRFRTRKG